MRFLDLVEVKSYPVMDFRVWKNPTREELFRLFETVSHPMRGTLTVHGDLYVWDPNKAVHLTVEEYFALEAEHQLVLRSDRIFLEYDVDEEEMKSIPGLARAYRGMDFDIENDSMIDDSDDV